MRETCALLAIVFAICIHSASLISLVPDTVCATCDVPIYFAVSDFNMDGTTVSQVTMCNVSCTILSANTSVLSIWFSGVLNSGSCDLILHSSSGSLVVFPSVLQVYLQPFILRSPNSLALLQQNFSSETDFPAFACNSLHDNIQVGSDFHWTSVGLRHDFPTEPTFSLTFAAPTGNNDALASAVVAVSCTIQAVAWLHGAGVTLSKKQQQFIISVVLLETAHVDLATVLSATASLALTVSHNVTIRQKIVFKAVRIPATVPCVAILLSDSSSFVAVTLFDGAAGEFFGSPLVLNMTCSAVDLTVDAAQPYRFTVMCAHLTNITVHSVLLMQSGAMEYNGSQSYHFVCDEIVEAALAADVLSVVYVNGTSIRLELFRLRSLSSGAVQSYVVCDKPVTTAVCNNMSLSVLSDDTIVVVFRDIGVFDPFQLVMQTRALDTLEYLNQTTNQLVGRSDYVTLFSSVNDLVVFILNGVSNDPCVMMDMSIPNENAVKCPFNSVDVRMSVVWTQAGQILQVVPVRLSHTTSWQWTANVMDYKMFTLTWFTPASTNNTLGVISVTADDHAPLQVDVYFLNSIFIDTSVLSLDGSTVVKVFGPGLCDGRNVTAAYAMTDVPLPFYIVGANDTAVWLRPPVVSDLFENVQSTLTITHAMYGNVSVGSILFHTAPNITGMVPTQGDAAGGYSITLFGRFNGCSIDDSTVMFDDDNVLPATVLLMTNTYVVVLAPVVSNSCVMVPVLQTLPYDTNSWILVAQGPPFTFVQSAITTSVIILLALTAAVTIGAVMTCVLYRVHQYRERQARTVRSRTSIAINSGDISITLPQYWHVPEHPGQMSAKGVELKHPKTGLSLRSDTSLFQFRWEELTVGECIGSGSFGNVHKGLLWETPVAVKILHCSDDVARAAFEKEVATLRALRHPNIVLFVAALPERVAFVTEFMSKGSLYHVLRTEAHLVTGAVALRIAIDVACAMQYLYSREPAIMHRDLTSSNILLDASLNAKVADFGFARLRAASSIRGAIGSPAWTAPELIRDGKFTQQSDVFSYGVVLWELFTHRVPYDGLPPLKVLAQKMQQTTDSYMCYDMPEQTPPDIVVLVRQCTQRDAALRPCFSDIVPQLHRIRELRRDARF
eukprot:TRINITY_DN3925_c0_g1_i1.p1 TRINITY_DN3925_c0_g1~~TRINITY_DN3925_c0_g1_i1.p1  ORF type:complete len:1121 (-),score=222.82 TRINITY_DN3925_c0_g1_i1:8-3370(-)